SSKLRKGSARSWSFTDGLVSVSALDLLLGRVVRHALPLERLETWRSDLADPVYRAGRDVGGDGDRLNGHRRSRAMGRSSAAHRARPGRATGRPTATDGRQAVGEINEWVRLGWPAEPPGPCPGCRIRAPHGLAVAGRTRLQRSRSWMCTRQQGLHVENTRERGEFPRVTKIIC